MSKIVIYHKSEMAGCLNKGHTEFDKLSVSMIESGIKRLFFFN